MRNVIFILIVLFYLIVISIRLPDWDSNKTIWVAAAKTDSLDPWNLNNAAHFTHDNRSTAWLYQLVNLDIPKWLPIADREPYYIGYNSLANSLRASGFINEYYQVENLKSTKLIDRKPPEMTYVVK